ncbi:hypothetical protein CTAYLR_000031 [Chrysophaeum taylorii]|uniref:Exostosin GT47 domain-containing protein n=1 Tax=Chrysophaeum taylorii TaxID=2483200 RepID=A0AAD7UGN1_9STRA|nr:hypothetical protein CTAYLR_000031 [Chrysophaeum taylorii]
MLLLLLLLSVVLSGHAGSQRAPRVYVYDVPEFWDVEWGTPEELRELGETRKAEKEIYGSDCVDDERKTEMFAASMIVVWRALRSYYEPDPSRADLFLVPLWPRQKNYAEWKDACSLEVNLDVELKLPHLDERTAHRHMIVVGKGHSVPQGYCDAWWRDPRGLLRSAMRFAYSSDYHGYGPSRFDDDGAVPTTHLTSDNGAFPHLVSIPYAASIHARSAYGAKFYRFHREAHLGSRHYLASFFGNSHATFNTTGGKYAKSRLKLMKECDATDDCLRVSVDKNLRCGDLGTAYANATFCFQPGGDSPYRKGLYDSLLVGCIPVIFSLYNARVSPWHFWADHRRDMVVVNETAYLSGGFDIFDYLRAIPSPRIRAMQASIAVNAHRLQYALEDYPDDAVDILLKGAWHFALARDAGVQAKLESRARLGKHPAVKKRYHWGRRPKPQGSSAS